MFTLFPLGQIVATPGTLAALERAKQPPSGLPTMQSETGANWSQPM